MAYWQNQPWSPTSYHANTLPSRMITLKNITPEQRNSYEIQFNNLRPVGGYLSGDQVKPLFSSFGLNAQVLSQIWSLIDQDKDGRINKAEFCAGMHLITFSSQGGVLPYTIPQWLLVDTSQSTKDFGGVGRTVPLNAMAPSWRIPQAKKESYHLVFNNQDRRKNGYLSGEEVSMVLSKSGVANSVLAQIWKLCDQDGDGRVNVDEFCAAMWLTERAKQGTPVPSTLPSDLIPAPVPVGTSDFLRRSSFEDKRMENFERGRMELQRRKREIKEREEREKAEQERQRAEDEEKRRRERERAEQHRQAELLRQKQKALEIEQERERQMQKLVLQREAEARELERKRREEYIQQQRKELLMVKKEELLVVEGLKSERRELGSKLVSLATEHAIKLDSIKSHNQLCREKRDAIAKLKTTCDIRQAELSQLTSSIQEWQVKLASCEREKKLMMKKQVEKEASSPAVNNDTTRLHKACIQLQASISKLKMQQSHQQELLKEHQSQLQANRQALKTLEVTYKAEKKSCEEVSIQLEKRKIFAAKKKREEEQRQHKLEQQRREEQRRQEQERLRKQKEEDDKRGHEEAERKKWEELRRLQEEEAKRKLEQQKKEEDAKRLLEEQQKEMEEKKRQQEEATRWEELRKIQSGNVGGDYEMPPESPLDQVQPTSSNSWLQSFTNESTSIAEVERKNSAQRQEEALRWGELRKVQSGYVGGNYEMSPVSPLNQVQPLQPAPYKSSSASAIELDRKDLAPKKKAAPRPPVPAHGIKYLQTQPVPIITTEVPTPVTSPMGSWDPKFNFAMATTVQSTTATTTTSSSNVRLKSDQSKLRDLVKEQSTVSLQQGLYTSTTEDELTKSTHVSASVELAYPQNEIVQYRALYNYNGQHYDELSFNEGDIINACDLNSTNAGWIGAELNGVQGLIPQTYVEVITTTSTVPTPQSPTTPTPQTPTSATANKPQINRRTQPTIKSNYSLRSPDSPVTTDKAAKKLGLKACALYTWQPSNASKHLKMKKGDIITIVEQRDNWWAGTIDKQCGWFPKSYVQLMEGSAPSISVTSASSSSNVSREASPVPHRKNALLFEALYDYNGEREGDLQFKIGDKITVTNRSGNWWTGTLNGHSGVFPSNYVQPVRGPSPGLIGSPKAVVAKVVVPYTAVKDNQLSLEQGQLIHVLEQDSSGWWKGQLHSRGKQRVIGWFPANRVELLTRTKTSPPPHDVVDTSSSSLSSSGFSHGKHFTRLAKSSLASSTSSIGPPSANYALALYSYTADNSDELTFYKGSVIAILSKEDSDWWKGDLNGQIGLVPANYVQELDDLQSSITSTRWKEAVSPHQLSKMTDLEIKKQEAIFELITTEKSYVESLKLVDEVFFDPLQHSNVLDQSEFKQVQVNWPELIKCNSALLSELMIRLRISNMCVDTIGDILVREIPTLKPHIRWCSRQLNACTLLQNKATHSQAFREFEAQCMADPRTAGLPLSSFLLKPMQRITKYPLLIERIIKYTEETHDDLEELKNAMELAQKLCREVNEGVRYKENTEHLEWIQSHVQTAGLNETLIFNSQTHHMGHRKLLHWGRVLKLRGNRDLLCFLFNDILVLCKPKHSFTRPVTPSDFEPFGNTQYILYKKPFLLQTVQAKKGTFDSYPPSTFVVNIVNEEKDMGLRVESDAARDQWVEKITKAGVHYMQKKKQKEKAHRERMKSITKGSIAKLIVTVVEAADLKASDPNGKSDPFCVVRVGTQEQKTDVIEASLNPKWNKKMEFYLFDTATDRLEVTVFDRDLFSPNDFLGHTHIKISDILEDGRGPWIKRQLLENVHTGEIEIRLEYHQVVDQ